MSEINSSAFDRRTEVEALLEADESLLGRVYRYDRDGLTPQQMGEEERFATFSFAYKYLAFIRGLITGEVPTSPTVSKELGAKVRAWLKRREVSPQLREELTTYERLLSSRADDKVAQAEETEVAVETSKRAEASGTPGIYVYTLPHYLRYPYDPATGRTLLKVGHSAVDAYYRATSQGRLTALPEDPILLRIYPVEASASVERTFHSWLRDADHPGSRADRGGSEWFVTSTKFLDRVAQSMGLDVQIVNQFEVGDE